MKLTVKFYSLLTSFRVIAKEDVKYTDEDVRTGERTNGNLHAEVDHANTSATKMVSFLVSIVFTLNIRTDTT